MKELLFRDNTVPFGGQAVTAVTLSDKDRLYQPYCLLVTDTPILMTGCFIVLYLYIYIIVCFYFISEKSQCVYFSSLCII